jgi:ferrous iron transport protein B
LFGPHPIYTILIGLVVPEVTLLGVLNLQGVALMALYLLGFVAALLSAVVMKWVLKTKDRSFLIMELPDYRMPRWGNVGITILEKVKAFVLEAGKVIIAISIILWVLSSYGPGNQMEDAARQAARTYAAADESTRENRVPRPAWKRRTRGTSASSSSRPSARWATTGRSALRCSARLRPGRCSWAPSPRSTASAAATTTPTPSGSGCNRKPTRVPAAHVHPGHGLFLLIFYAFAMMCMSTLAVVHRETRGWTWPAIQFFYMTGLAYVSAWLVYVAL